VLASAAASVPAGSAAGLSVEQKRKLLWGGKKSAGIAAAGVGPSAVSPAAAAGAAAAPAPAPSAAVFGRNRWDQAEFGSEQERLRFIKLMGGRAAADSLQQGAAGPATAAPASPPPYGPALPGDARQLPGAAAGPAAATEGQEAGDGAPAIMKREYCWLVVVVALSQMTGPAD
jgi:hypothetical protein